MEIAYAVIGAFIVLSLWTIEAKLERIADALKKKGG